MVHGADKVVVTVWALLGTYGLVTNLLITAGILCNRKLRQATSYWLILSLSMCDSCMIIICLLHILPATAYRDDFPGMVKFWNAFSLFIYDTFWYSGVLHLALMSINRFVNICYPKWYCDWFSPGKTLIQIGLCIVGGVSVSLPGLFACCYLVYNPHMYSVQYEPLTTPYQYVDLVVNGCSCVLMIFCYTCILMKVRSSRILLHKYRTLITVQSAINVPGLYETCIKRQSQSVSSQSIRQDVAPPVRLRKLTNWDCPSSIVPISKSPSPVSSKELRLLLQFAVVSLVFLLSVATWQWLPRVSQSKWAGFVVTSLFFINNATNPTVYLVFNLALRAELQSLLRLILMKVTRIRRNTSTSTTSRFATSTLALTTTTNPMSQPNLNDEKKEKSTKLKPLKKLFQKRESLDSMLIVPGAITAEMLLSRHFHVAATRLAMEGFERKAQLDTISVASSSSRPSVATIFHSYENSSVESESVYHLCPSTISIVSPMSINHLLPLSPRYKPHHSSSLPHVLTELSTTL